MAATITKSKRGTDTIGRRQHIVVNFLADASYPNPAGYPVTVGQLGGRGRAIEGFALLSGHNGFTPRWDPASGSVKVYRTGAINAAMEHVPNGTSLTGVNWDLAFYVV